MSTIKYRVSSFLKRYDDLASLVIHKWACRIFFFLSFSKTTKSAEWWSPLKPKGTELCLVSTSSDRIKGRESSPCPAQQRYEDDIFDDEQSIFRRRGGRGRTKDRWLHYAPSLVAAGSCIPLLLVAKRGRPRCQNRGMIRFGDDPFSSWRSLIYIFISYIVYIIFLLKMSSFFPYQILAGRNASRVKLLLILLQICLWTRIILLILFFSKKTWIRTKRK